VDALARLQAGGLAAAEAHPLSPAAGLEAREALSRFIEHHLGRRLASRKFLDEIGPLLG
jgi:DNA repair protein RecO (recombination protein O)